MNDENEKSYRKSHRFTLKRGSLYINNVKYGARHVTTLIALAALMGGTKLYFIRIHRLLKKEKNN